MNAAECINKTIWPIVDPKVQKIDYVRQKSRYKWLISCFLSENILPQRWAAGCRKREERGTTSNQTCCKDDIYFRRKTTSYFQNALKVQPQAQQENLVLFVVDIRSKIHKILHRNCNYRETCWKCFLFYPSFCLRLCLLPRQVGASESVPVIVTGKGFFCAAWSAVPPAQASICCLSTGRQRPRQIIIMAYENFTWNSAFSETI